MQILSSLRANSVQHSFLLLGSLCGLIVAGGCSLFATRPYQEMSDTSAAIKAAHEVNADSLAPELYRQANDWFFKAKNEYKLKNFSQADEYATKARYYAEQAEFESIRNGGIRSETKMTDPLSDTGMPSEIPPPPEPPAPAKEPYAYPSTTGRPAEYIMKDAAAQPAPTAPGATPGMAPTTPTAPTTTSPWGGGAPPPR